MQDGIIDKNEGDPSCAISRLLVFSELVKRSEDSQGLDRQPNDLRSIHGYVMGLDSPQRVELCGVSGASY